MVTSRIRLELPGRDERLASSSGHQHLCYTFKLRHMTKDILIIYMTFVEHLTYSSHLAPYLQ